MNSFAPGVLICVSLVAAPAKAESDAFQYKTLDCLMQSQIVTVIEQGKIATKTPKDQLAITFTSFDYAKGKAIAAGNAGSDDLYFFPSAEKAVFFSLSQSGNGFLTTISNPIAGKSMIFHSRHSWILREPIVSEYLGTCTVRK